MCVRRKAHPRGHFVASGDSQEPAFLISAFICFLLHTLLSPSRPGPCLLVLPVRPRFPSLCISPLLSRVSHCHSERD